MDQMTRPALTDLQQRLLWDNWLSAEIRAYYFGTMAERVQHRQNLATWLMVLLSSGATVTILAKLGSQWAAAVAPLLALLTTAMSLWLLIEQNQRRVALYSDLFFRRSRLASEFQFLWDDMYSEDALSKLKALDEKVAELSKSSISKKYNVGVMLESQRHVERLHGLAA